MNDWAGFRSAVDKVDPGRLYFKGKEGTKYIVSQKTYDAMIAAGYDPDDFLVSHHLPKNTAYEVSTLQPTGMEDSIGAHRRFLEELGKTRAEALARATMDAAYRDSIAAQYTRLTPQASIGFIMGAAIA